ncbi:MAG: CopD family protein [Verrucomicrobia bacterium]|nr:CopD family protein [Verrucomicrobiota bacterium]
MAFTLVVARWLHWATCLLLASSQLFRIWLLPRMMPDEAAAVRAWRDAFLCRLGTLARAVWVGGLVSFLAWCSLTTLEMTGYGEGFDFSLIATVVTGTQFGRVSQARLVLLVLAGAFLFDPRRRSTRANNGVSSVMLLILVTLCLLTLALTGHAAATSGPAGTVHLTVDAIHLAVTAIWPGGLVGFAMLLRSALRFRPAPLVGVAARATNRFSTFSLVAVAALSATGLAMSFFFLHDLRELWTTSYGRLLMSKVLLFAVMVAIGAWNLFVLKRKLRRHAHADQIGEPCPAMGLLLRNVRWEIGLGGAVLLAAVALGITEPPTV